MKPNHDFLVAWDYYMVLGSIVLAALGVLILLYHEFKVLVIKDYKEKYDYINLHEIKYFWYAVVVFIVAVALFANSVITMQITSTARGMLFFYIRIFITAGFTVIAYTTFYSAVRIYYPKYLEKKLNKWRTKPRFSPAGNEMRRLSEEEEDAHLEAHQIEEEATIHSVDYDVWLDEKTGYKKVEKYNAYQHAEECPECGYFTLKIDREELRIPPTDAQAGLLLKHYKCDYCNHRVVTETKLARLSANA
jgi:hypothetical protein